MQTGDSGTIELFFKDDAVVFEVDYVVTDAGRLPATVPGDPVPIDDGLAPEIEIEDYRRTDFGRTSVDGRGAADATSLYAFAGIGCFSGDVDSRKRRANEFLADEVCAYLCG